MKKIDLNFDASSEISKIANITQKDTKFETSEKVSNIGLNLGSSDKDYTSSINKTNILEMVRRDNFGIPIIKGRKSHKIIFKDQLFMSENCYYRILDEVEVESFKKYNKLLFKFNNINNCNSCSGACLIS